MEFYDKYSHVGYSHLGVPDAWKPIVERAIIAIEKEMWPTFMPMFLKRWIHYWATGNSIVCVKNRFWEKVRSKLTHHMMITDIKDKYATLRIYGYFNDKIYKIIEQAEKECENTCEFCGSIKSVEIRNDFGWMRNLCSTCNSILQLKR